MTFMASHAHSRQVIVLAVLLALVSAGCAGGHWAPRAASISARLAESVERVQTTVIDLHDQQLMPDAEYATWQTGFRKFAAVGLALDDAIRKSDGANAATQINAAVDVVDDLMRANVIKVGGEQGIMVMIGLEGVRTVLLSLAAAVE